MCCEEIITSDATPFQIFTKSSTTSWPWFFSAGWPGVFASVNLRISSKFCFAITKKPYFYAVFRRFWWHVLPEWTMSTESKKLLINCQIFTGIMYNVKVAYALFPKISNRCQFISGDFIVKANNSGKFLEWFFRHDCAENGTSYFVIPQIINGLPVTVINSSQNQNISLDSYIINNIPSNTKDS